MGITRKRATRQLDAIILCRFRKQGVPQPGKNASPGVQITECQNVKPALLLLGLNRGVYVKK